MGNCLSFANDRVQRLKLLVNCLISSDDPELPTSSLISSDDPVQHLEWLETNRDFVVPIKGQIHTLKVELKFLRTHLKWCKGKGPKYRLMEPMKCLLQTAASELFSLCHRPSTDRSMASDLESLISRVQKEMDGHKQAIRSGYVTNCSISRKNKSMRYEIVMELVDSVLENLKDLQSCRTNLILFLKRQLEALEDKLLSVRNLLAFNKNGKPSTWLSRLRDSENDTEHEKFERLLTHTEYVVDNSAYLLYFCLVDEEDEKVRLNCNFSHLVEISKHIELEAKEMYITISKYSMSSSNSRTLPITLLRLLDFDSHLDNLMQLSNCNFHFMAPVKDDIVTLYDGMMFLRTLLMDPPPTKHTEHKNMDSLLTKVESLLREAGSVICSFLEKTEFETAEGMNRVPFSLLEKIKLIKSEVRDSYMRRLNHFPSNFLWIDGVGYIDFLLKNLDELVNCHSDSIVILKNQIESVQNELRSRSSFVKNIIGAIDMHDLKTLMKHDIDMAHKAHYIISSYVVRDFPEWNYMLWISDLLKEFKLNKLEVRQICGNKRSHTTEKYDGKTSPPPLSKAHSRIIEEVVIGFQDEANKIIERLIGGSRHLDIVSIVGMPGLGKTTLAKKVYNDPSVAHYFYIRAWCCISQTYQRRELLLDILSHIIELTDRFYIMSDEDLVGQLYKRLKGRKYLIFLDDIWNIGGWNDLRQCFPNDQNGSRIMITSRIYDVALQANPHSSPHLLRLFSEDESWELFQEKLFQQEKCPVELVKVGKEIARKCSGLPLIVVVTAGLLAKKDKKKDQWKQFAESLNLFIINESTQWMDILEMSYNHLPDHLKPCFLYFGAFTAGKKISVKKLLLLWIAEGLVHRSQLKSVEDTAEEYLMDLIGRSLIIVDKYKSNGGVKTCHVHDLLHDLCLAKAKRENFLQLVTEYDELYAPYLGDCDDPVNDYINFSPVPQQLRVSIYCNRTDFIAWKPSNRHVCSLMFFATDDMYSEQRIYPWDFSFISYSLKLLKVLDLSCISVGDSFPSGIEFLVHLRYLAVRGGMNSIPSSVANLVNLEILFVKGVKGEVELPDTIWKMVMLRHLHVEPRVAFSLLNGRPVIGLQNIATLSTPCFSHEDDTMMLIRGLSSLRKLKCIFMESWEPVKDCNQFPVLDSLHQLESLKVIYQGNVRKAPNFNFPLNLKKLTLAKFCLPWSAISEFQRLPNLEVLKLLSRAFEGKTWDVRDDEFLKLKYLKLYNINFTQWNASKENFPRLQRLVLHQCKYLAEIPSDFGSIPTLQLIDMKWCSPSAADSARKIQEEQENLGNEEFEVLFDTSS